MTTGDEIREGFDDYLNEYPVRSPMLEGMARRLDLEKLAPAIDAAVEVAERTEDIDEMVKVMFAKIRDVFPEVVGPALGAPLAARVDGSPLESLFDDVAIRGAAALSGLREWGAQFSEATDRYLPKNWGSGVYLTDVLTLTQDFGIPLVDHPPRAVVDAFTGAVRAGTSPYEVFETHRDLIINDLASLCTTVGADDERITSHAANLAEIVETLRHGLNLAAQRAAASLIDVITREILGVGTTRPGPRELITRHANDHKLATSPWIEIRERSAVHCAVLVLEPWTPGIDPITARLNRHMTVHTASPIQHTPVNAMWAALIVGNLLALERRHRGAELLELRDRLLTRRVEAWDEAGDVGFDDGAEEGS